MGILFRVKKKLLTRAAIKLEKKKLIKEAQARIESDELKQLQKLKSRIAKAKNVNVPKNILKEIKARKATRRMLLKSAGKGLKTGARSSKKIFSELQKLASAQKVKEIKARKKTRKKKVKRRKK